MRHVGGMASALAESTHRFFHQSCATWQTPGSRLLTTLGRGLVSSSHCAHHPLGLQEGQEGTQGPWVRVHDHPVHTWQHFHQQQPSHRYHQQQQQQQQPSHRYRQQQQQQQPSPRYHQQQQQLSLKYHQQQQQGDCQQRQHQLQQIHDQQQRQIHHQRQRRIHYQQQRQAVHRQQQQTHHDQQQHQAAALCRPHLAASPGTPTASVPVSTFMQLRTHIGHHHGLGPLQGAEGEPGAKGKGKPEPGKGGEEEEGGFHERGARESELISRVGLWADVALTGAKGAAGWLSGSTAILADAAHSVSDIVMSWVSLWSVRAANAPKDKEHPYGHGKFQSLGALGVSVVLLGTGAGIAWHAFGVLQDMLPLVLSQWPFSALGPDTLGIPPDAAGAAPTPAPAPGSASAALLHGSDTSGVAHGHTSPGNASQGLGHGQGQGHGHGHGIDMQHLEVALGVAVVSVGVKEGLYWATRGVGERYHNSLMKANAWHHRSDAVSSVAAAVGVGGTMVGVPVLDPAAALLVSGMIMRAGASIALESCRDLVDVGLPDPLLAQMRKTVQAVPGVQGCHNMRGRRMGSSLHLDTHIEVLPHLTVEAGHRIGKEVKQQLRRSFPAVTEVFVHVAPARKHHGNEHT